MPEKIIGHGTWYDKTAVKIIEREQKLGRRLDNIRTESGLGASGIPHIGSFADCARSYAVTLALQEQGYKSEYIAFADDLDGLRKVPAGLPESLGKYLGHPVTSIPDLYGCHESFGEHITSLLLEALDESGIKYTFISAKQAYEMSGLKPSDVDVVELHDCFSIAEIADSEDLGFFGKGKGGHAVETGITQVGGKLPINPSGGLLSKGHPVGATGMGQINRIMW